MADKNLKRPNSFIDSFNCAIEGFFYVMRTQRNMRIHFLLGVAVFLSGILLDFTRIELICLGVVTTIVLLVEMINTAVENIVDLISDTYHPFARTTKDVGAGAVLLASICAVICGYLLFSRHMDFSLVGSLSKVKDAPFLVTLISLIIVFSFVMLGKLFFKKGTPMRGGMPSGHAAIAFSLWVIIIFSTSNPLIIALTLVLALAVARSRYSQRIHTLWEIVAGALLGILATTLIIQIFK